MHKLLFIILSIFCCSSLSAQISKVMVTNSESGDRVRIKWLEEDLYGMHSTNVYRREVGTSKWILLTELPITARPVPEPFAEGEEGSQQALAGELIGKRVEELDDYLQILFAIQFVETGSFLDYLGVYFEDQTAVSGTTYEYKITKLKDGREQDLGISPPHKVEVHSPSKVVKEISLTISPDNDSLVLFNWLPEAAEYFTVNVYRTELPDGQTVKLNENPVFISQTENEETGELIYPEFLYSKNGHIPGKTYRFELEAVDFWNRPEKKSEPIDLRIPNRTPAPLPADFNITKTSLRSALISWSDLPLEEVSGVNLYVSRDDENFTLLNEEPIPPTVRTYNFEVEDFGHRYFIIETLNEEGFPNQSYSKLKGFPDLEPPMVPQNVQFEADTGRIEITWDANPETDLRGYILFRRTDKGDEDDFIRLNATPFKENRYSDKLPKRAKNKFIYKVAAIDTLDNMSNRSEPAGIRMPDVVAPAKPFITNVEKGDDRSVSLTWLPVLDADLVGYQVERSEGGSDNVILLTPENLSPGTAYFKDSLTSAGTNYRYRISASDDSGNISYSDFYTVSIAPDQSERPRGSLSANYKKKKNQVTLEWEQLTAADVRGYIISRQTDGGQSLALTGLLTGENTFTDTDITPGTTYTYRLKTYYRDGRVGESEDQSVEIPASDQ